jgi:hypothetical protein
VTGAAARVLRRLVEIGPGRTAVAIAILQFSAVIAVGGYAAQHGPREAFAGSWMELARPGDDPLGKGIASLERWDALWYQHIALDGYAPDNGTTAFMPVYPLIGRAVSVVLLGNVALALLLVSCTFYPLALWLLARLVAHEAPLLGIEQDDAGQVGIVTMLGLATFPTAFFFVAPFTESPFLALTLASVLMARRGRLGWAAALGAIAALVRVQGVLLALVIAWEGLRAAGLLAARSRPSREDLRRAVPALLPAAVPVLALGGWYLLLSAALARPALGASSQALWGYQLVSPWDAMSASVAYIQGLVRRPMAYIEGLNLACLVGFAGLLVAARRLPFSAALYAVPSLALVSTRAMFMLPLMSVSRYVLTIFPAFLWLGVALWRHPRIAVGWLVAGAIAQLLLVQWFARWGFVA